jgi:hypothetical protein
LTAWAVFDVVDIVVWNGVSLMKVLRDVLDEAPLILASSAPILLPFFKKITYLAIHKPSLRTAGAGLLLTSSF